MRAFIFSLDAFVAFTLALVAIYSLIFFSSVPSSYYYLLTQGHYLTRDTLMSLSTSVCTEDYGSICRVDGSVLDNVVADANATSELSSREHLVKATIGEMIPEQFGYRLEVRDDEDESWDLVYDTAQDPSDPHANTSKKLSVSSQVITFGYSGKLHKFGRSPYNYLSCGFNADSASEAASAGEFYQDWGIIVCGRAVVTGGGAGGDDIYLGNVHPKDVLDGDIVPSSDIKVVRFTVYI